MTSKSCPRGSILRKSYSRKSKSGKKIHIKSSCIKATGSHGSKTPSIRKSIVRSILSKQKKASSKTKASSPKSCPKGYILRSAYIRSPYKRSSYSRSSGSRISPSSVKGTIVPAKCIKSRGHDDKPGLFDKEGKRIYIVLEKGSLSKHGYTNVDNLSSSQRQKALDSAIKELDGNWLSIFRKINYLAVLNKYNPKLHKIFIADRDYIKSKYTKK